MTLKGIFRIAELEIRYMGMVAKMRKVMPVPRSSILRTALGLTAEPKATDRKTLIESGHAVEN